MPRSLLLILAHPDDETFLAGGTACRYAEQGARVSLITATRGESGKTGDPPACAPEDLAAVREAELRAAAVLLGMAEVTILGYHDRSLASAPVADVRQALVGAIRRLRPDVVITFDPHGSNGHPDHVAISRFTSDAVVAAADARWFPAAGAAFQVPRVVWSPPARPWELATADDLAARAGADFVIDVRAWSERKLDAVAAHRSQNLSARRILNHPDRARRLSIEVFRQAWGPPLASRPLHDLFAGLQDGS